MSAAFTAGLNTRDVGLLLAIAINAAICFVPETITLTIPLNLALLSALFYLFWHCGAQSTFHHSGGLQALW